MKKTLAAFLYGLLVWQSVAFAVEQSPARQIDLGSGGSGTPTDICTAKAVNTAATCGNQAGYDVSGYNVATLFITYTRSAGTGLGFAIEATNDPNCSSASTTCWFLVHTAAVVAGTMTLSPLSVLKTVSATSYYTASLGINYKKIRFNTALATGAPGAGDKMSLSVLVASSPGI